MGADKGILVKYDKVDEFINTEFIVNILENICKQENPDIIIMGKQAIDTDNHQTAEYLSEKLNIGNASQANSIDIDKEKNIAIVKKEVDGGLETISLALPCIITTDLRLNEPRYASLPGIMKAKRKPLKLIDLSSLQLNTNSNFEILSVNTPTKRKVGSIVKTTDELIEKLHSEIKTI
jgi:electron transfer flavoprotein beta subunit